MGWSRYRVEIIELYGRVSMMLNKAQRFLIGMFLVLLVPVLLMMIGDYEYEAQIIQRDPYFNTVLRPALTPLPFIILLVVGVWGLMLGIVLWLLRMMETGMVTR